MLKLLFRPSARSALTVHGEASALLKGLLVRRLPSPLGEQRGRKQASRHFDTAMSLLSRRNGHSRKRIFVADTCVERPRKKARELLH